MTKTRMLCAAALLALSAVGASAQILIGQTTGVTGSVAASVNETIGGAQLLIDSVNAQGGIHGEKIEILRMDDGFDVKRASENARVLIEDKKVLALFMSRGTPHSQAIIPWLDKYDVALIGPSTGAMVLHKPLQKHVFNVRATYQREAEKAVQHLLTIGLTRIAVVHVTDSFGTDALEGAMTGFAKGKAKPVVTIPADRDKPDYKVIVPAIKDANAQAVVDRLRALPWSTASRRCARAARRRRWSRCRTTPPRASSSSLGDASKGVIVTQVFPNERSLGQPMVKEAQALAQAKGQAELSPAMLEGFASAKVLVEAQRRAGPKPTRAKMVAALEGLQGLRPGRRA